MQLDYTWKKRVGPVLHLQTKSKEYGICFCHRNKDRSINFLGLGKLLCSRCLGIFLGGITGASFHFFGYLIKLTLAILFAIPLLIDGFTQYFGLRESNNMLRLSTGFIFGISLNYVGVLL
ncbi:DUF2085 domain-containing protein [Candidatus Woesearchaeota archaeon]|nr:DUF2085 domain-containing protein [Candidatus Woesearchaeota archaeon]